MRLLTIHGRLLVMLSREAMTKAMIADALDISLKHAERLVSDLRHGKLVCGHSRGPRHVMWYSIDQSNMETMRIILMGDS